MRAYFALTLLVAIFAVLAAAQPFEKDEEPDTLPAATTLLIAADLPAEEGHLREKRATCDLLQPLNLGNAPCAVNCIRLGYKGGWCNNKGVCNCRR